MGGEIVSGALINEATARIQESEADKIAFEKGTLMVNIWWLNHPAHL